MKGQRRLDDPNDYVRLEIASALKRDIPVIPVLVGQVSMPDISQGLLADLAELTKKQAASVRAGRDLANDLQSLVRGVKRALKLPPLTPSDLALPPGVKIVPQGLRSFDEKDNGFFIYLLPGPYQDDGLPEKLCFWKTRIEAMDAESTFRVGLIYGPSGCGKSSLVKAGLLPRLSPDVTVVYVEATATDTEARLLAALHRHCPYLASESSLKAALGCKDKIPSDKKLLIVLDQFEQYLHSTPEDEQDDLAEALRECDGSNFQCILMVRDDFLTPINRFMNRLHIPLAEDRNLTLVDLFDNRHAKKVLALLGQAYGGLPKSDRLTKEQDAFLNQAVSELAEGDHVISVRLALFAQMFEGKEWKPATLKEVGGATGVGVAFLEDSFVAKTAPEDQRHHRVAAQGVLGALLPEPGTTIKGAMRTRQELLKKSGYARRPEQFDQLIEILDKKLRLVTPTEPVVESSDGQPKQSTDGEKRYQLTHDYLVPSLREWLTRKQRETRKGRAELRLAERSTLWNAKPENQQLPSLWEFLNIRLMTNRKNWTEPQRKMMGRAGRVQAIRSGIVAVVLVVASVAGISIRNAIVAEQARIHEENMEKQNITRAEGLVEGLTKADINQVPSIIGSLKEYRTWADPLLKAKFDQAKEGSSQRLNLALALLPVDAMKVEYLYARLLTAEPDEVPVICDALTAHKDELVPRLWAIVEMPEQGQRQQRLRAAAALAKYDPENQRWAKASSGIVEDLVSVNPVFLGLWSEAFRPVKARLLGPLSDVFRQQQLERTAERTLATSLLADYAADQPQVLADLVMDADEKQFTIIFTKLKERGKDGLPLLEGELGKEPTLDPTEEDKEKLAKRQANAAVALLKMSPPAKAWSAMKHSPDPRARTYLIHGLAPLGADVTSLVRRLDEEADVSSRRALILCLGEFDTTQLPATERQPLIAKLLDLYQNDPDSGLHGAVEWLLRQKGWDQGDKLSEIDAQLQIDDKQLQARKATDERQWCVNTQGQTFAILNADKPFRMGSPESEPDRQGVEIPHERRIGRRFAIASKEVTKAQFRNFQEANPDVEKFNIEQYSRTDDSPQVGVDWYDAVRYCNWLSEKEGIPKDQWCYEPNSDGKYAEGMKPAADYLQRSGYRLPTEAEWEYACRSGSQTSRYYGLSVKLLPKYARFLDNSDNRAWPVGMQKPNDYGLFDMLGNAFEWCDDRYEKYAVANETGFSEDLGTKADVGDKDDSRVLRGGSFFNRASNVRSATRGFNVPTYRDYFNGFRAARTYP